MMIMVVIVMLPGGDGSRRLRPRRSWSLRRKGWSILLGNTTDCAEPVLQRVFTAAREAGPGLRRFGCGAGRGVRVYLCGQPLNCLQRRRNGFVTRLRLMQVLLQSPKEVIDGRIMGRFSVGSRNRRIPNWPGWFFVIHKDD